uniref:Uncharacterized protein n=1 Tax=Spongospora subterranea TaxID=70186 RepID=A0A0H5QZA2_9EUKA|eukprot:CRZ07038.1 hypothetical protein [Spongospora subterranea]
MEHNKNNIHVAVSYLEETAVCLCIVNLPHEINHSIGRVVHYIVPIISKSHKMVRGSSFYTFLVGVGGSNFAGAFEGPAVAVVAMTSTSLISKGFIFLGVLSEVLCGVCCFSM